jgi:hypothetical protein
MTDSASKRAKRAQARRERLFVEPHPKVVAILCSIIAFGLAAAVRSSDLVGHIPRGLAATFVALGIVAVVLLVVRARLRARKTNERIDDLLAQRVRSAVRFEEHR